MFFPSDPFSEIVVHFLGYFQIAAEDMKVRLELALAEHDAEPAPEAPEMQQVSVDVLQAYALGKYTPGVFYAPPEYLIRGEAMFGPAEIGLANTPDFTASELHSPLSQWPAGPGDLVIPLIGIEPGSVIAVISQTIHLSDDDVFIMGTLDEPLTFRSGADTGLLGLQAASNEVLGPIGNGPGISSYDDVPLVMDAVNATAKAQQSNPDAQYEQVEFLTGTYVNGKSEAEVPDLADALPEHLQEQVADATTPNAIEVTGEHEAQLQLEHDNSQGSVTYNSGGNFLVNEATVLNGGLVGTHFVVGGNFHQLDAIVQTNAFSDIDHVNDDLPLSLKAGGGTKAVNVASFVQETFDAAGDNAEANPGVMPQNWQVTCVSGDVIFLEWMKQLTFMSDEDMGVLTASGSDAVVTSGENIAFNGVNFADIGLLFDLILVGGNVFDANVIVQNNILYDNDTVTMLGAGEDGDYPASGELNTSGNLLWNQAVIHNVGATEIKSGISDHYKDAMDGLAGGNKSMPASFYSAEEFEGIAIPRVLYVSGSIYDLRYVEQTNILGDGDFVALQKKAFLDGQPVTEWNIDTGSNALVNVAAIKDFDTFGDSIEVGGNHYSDSILIQANILQAQGDDGEDDDALVSEVVAFLDHTETLADNPDYSALGDTTHDAAPVDLMQSVLA
ncbi:hypothetical protein GGR20_002617 [Devosia subaequoris]|uniref:Type I secretion protein n=1 Tax=Devosia subaequoris TaxID=395930 RepID=A0A7W6NCR4_9HYPH|nr:hypothetical protein [Devosia subaequoris]MBB4052961.1 hypothetical protein [Devosia subaequoris]MCP1210380.1 hypothetical protein [Devosia subaequoris]